MGRVGRFVYHYHQGEFQNSWKSSTLIKALNSVVSKTLPLRGISSITHVSTRSYPGALLYFFLMKIKVVLNYK